MEVLFQYFSFLLVLLNLHFASALKFNIRAHPGHESTKHERCIRNFVARDQLVVVTAIVDGTQGDGQTLNMHVRVNDIWCLGQMLRFVKDQRRGG